MRCMRRKAALRFLRREPRTTPRARCRGKILSPGCRSCACRGPVECEHFTVDGTLIDAWASLKSFRAKNDATKPNHDDPSNPTINFHGERRTNETHESTTDPESMLMRKGRGKEAKI